MQRNPWTKKCLGPVINMLDGYSLPKTNPAGDCVAALSQKNSDYSLNCFILKSMGQPQRQHDLN